MRRNLKTFKLFFFATVVGLSTLTAQYTTVREQVLNLPNFDKKKVHYGYYLGFNQYDFKFRYIENYYTELGYKDIVTKQSLGFNVGIVGGLRINEFFNLRFEPGLYYNKRELLYPKYTEFERESDQKREIKSTYIHLPLILKITTRRINNFRPFLLAGISADYNLSSHKKNKDDNLNNIFRTNSTNLNYELGFGFDFYLFYFKFSPSLRGVFSLQNELVPDNDPDSPWTGKILNMLSRGMVVTFTFE